MIQKYLYGVPFDTESVVAPIPASQGEPPVGTVKTSESGFCFACPLAEGDRVYGLGEATRGINKRGSTSATMWTTASTPKTSSECTPPTTSS